MNKLERFIYDITDAVLRLFGIELDLNVERSILCTLEESNRTNEKLLAIIKELKENNE